MARPVLRAVVFSRILLLWMGFALPLNASGASRLAAAFGQACETTELSTAPRV